MRIDDELLRKAQAGDPDAFEALMADSEQMVWRVCWHYTGHREDASDCAQEAMIRLWRNLPGFRFECAFETWIYRICASCCLDFLRKARRRPAESLEPLAEAGFDPPDPSPGPEEQALREDEHARLREAIRDLPSEQRDALTLTQLEGRSYEETARLLSVTEGTVKSRVNRARTRLRELFSAEEKLSAAGGVQQEKGGSEPPESAGKKRKGGRKHG